MFWTVVLLVVAIYVAVVILPGILPLRFLNWCFQAFMWGLCLLAAFIPTLIVMALR